MLIAYAWASGVIEFGKNVPDYATLILAGEPNKLRQAVNSHARKLNSGVLLVPGMAESDNRHSAYSELYFFSKQVKQTYKCNGG
ncbi:host nuclease inhibitor protein [Brenneria alni]|uniref:host nuclease inhibitor protein n=1 Tax=Brenneria alni TaxID=71656 RepID=UPI0011C39EA6|nr:host nuclease inhibitor protein [Brenneria alni]